MAGNMIREIIKRFSLKSSSENERQPLLAAKKSEKFVPPVRDKNIQLPRRSYLFDEETIRAAMLEQKQQKTVEYMTLIQARDWLKATLTKRTDFSEEEIEGISNAWRADGAALAYATPQLLRTKFKAWIGVAAYIELFVEQEIGLLRSFAVPKELKELNRAVRDRNRVICEELQDIKSSLPRASRKWHEKLVSAFLHWAEKAMNSAFTIPLYRYSDGHHGNPWFYLVLAYALAFSLHFIISVVWENFLCCKKKREVMELGRWSFKAD